jgi:hypothetical protein
MLRTFLLAIFALLAGLLLWGGLLPAKFHVERSTVINAEPAAVYANVNDLSKWEAWSPWAKRDPNAKSVFEGPSSGPGAIMRWDGNDEVGKGALAITEVVPSEVVRIRLDFVRPFESTSDVGFTFKREGDGTRVTWTLDGAQGFVERLMCTVLRLDVDQMIGADYQAGLTALKSLVEKQAPS